MSEVSLLESFKVKSKISGFYNVYFIKDLFELQPIFSDNNIIYIIDNKVLKLYEKQFKFFNPDSRIVGIDSSEENKTIDYSQEIIRSLIDLNIRKEDKLIAIGGGITQDIVAFISSIIFRGVKWDFVPTTLLAQCDSCIGSKSSINFDKFKNLLGTFNPPDNIYVYSEFLETLTESEIRSGIGEMLHYFFTDNINLAKKITDEINDLINNRKKLFYFIFNSLTIKKKIIEIDEFDNSIRHIFNFGHTFGHAIEAIVNYSIPHGQAVTLGMDLANFIALKKNRICDKQFNMMHDILEKNIPSFKFTTLNINNYTNALSKDKKNKGNKIGCILTVKPGKVEKIFIENDNWLRDCIIEYSNLYFKP